MGKTRLATLLFLCLVLALISSIIPVEAAVETRYMRNSETTVNGLTAGALGTSQTTSGTNDYKNYFVSTIYWAWDVIKRSSGGAETVIGSKVGQVSRNGGGSGIQSATWNCPITTLSSTDAIRVSGFIKFGSGSWQAIGYGTAKAWITEQLGAGGLLASTWTFYTYTSWVNVGGEPEEVNGYLYWGSSTYNTRVEGISWTSTIASYYFYGQLDEDDNSKVGAINITAYYVDDTYVSFEVNSSLLETPYPFFSSGTVSFFQWDCGGGVHRRYFPTTENVIYVHVPDPTVAVYTFQIIDYTGTMSSGDGGYLSVKKLIQSSYQTLEKQTIPTSSLESFLILTQGRTYVLVVESPDGTIYQFEFFSGGDLSKNLYVKGVSFSKQVQAIYKYVRVEATRSADLDEITVNYEDTLDATTLVSVYLYYQNWTLADSDSGVPTAGLISFNFIVDNQTDYRVRAVMVHTTFGTLQQQYGLLAKRTYSSPFNLGFLGSVGWINMILPYGLIFCVAGVFSVLTAEIGMFATVTTAGLLWYLGWIDVTGATIALALTIVILFALLRKKREEGI